MLSLYSGCELCLCSGVHNILFIHGRTRIFIVETRCRASTAFTELHLSRGIRYFPEYCGHVNVVTGCSLLGGDLYGKKKKEEAAFPFLDFPGICAPEVNEV